MIINPAPRNSSGAHISTSANGDIGTSVAEHFVVPGAALWAVYGAHIFTTGLGDHFQDRCENARGFDALFTSDQSQDIITQVFSVDDGLR